MAAATHTHIQLVVSVGVLTDDVFTATPGDTTTVVLAAVPTGASLSDHEKREIGFAVDAAYQLAANDAI